MNPSRKKELVSAYKEREIEGGVYALLCKPNGKRFIEMTTDIAGAQNRFAFSVQTNLCPQPLLKPDWSNYGPGAFAFEVLETVPKKAEEDMEDYKKGLELLRDMLRAEAPEEGRYQ